MDNIFYLGFETEKRAGMVKRKGTYKSVEKNFRNYRIGHGKCYCAKCKTKFVSMEVANSPEYKSMLCLPKEEYNRILDKWHNKLVKCPECGFTVKIADLRNIEKKYGLCNGVFVNGDTLKINRRMIHFEFFNERIVTFNTHEMYVINMKTGQSYKFAKAVNGKIIKSEPRITPVTYTKEFFSDYDPYSDKCESLDEIFEKAYNIIRDYKINNSIVTSYIPTFEQNAKDYALREPNTFLEGLREPNTFLEVRIPFSSLFLFNRFPTLNFIDSINLFVFDKYSSQKNRYSRLRRSFDQNNNQIIKCILEKYKIPKSNKQQLLKQGFDFVDIYTELAKVLSPDNIRKVIKIITNINYAIDLVTFIKKFNLSEKQINSLCNKIQKYDDNYWYLIDTIRIGIKIKTIIADYTLDLKLPIKHLHEIVSIDYNKIRKENHKIDYSHLKNGINKFDFNKEELNFKLAKDTHELAEVGTKMNICVGGYDNLALKHSCYIVIVRNNENKPIVCIELDSKCKNIMQAKLAHNRIPNKDIGIIIEEWAINNNINYARDRYSEEEIEIQEIEDAIF